jgi:hypothetical protein
MVDELRFRSLLVMTDDSEALATVKNVMSTWTDQIIKVVTSLDEPEFSRTMFDPRKDNALMIYSGEKNACDVAVVSFLNILLAGQADGFVGTYNSNFGPCACRACACMPVCVGLRRAEIRGVALLFGNALSLIPSFCRPHGSASAVCHAWLHDPYGVPG